MTMLKNPGHQAALRTQWGWLLPILLLAPFSLAAKGCNDAVVGDDCPDAAKCNGSAGTGNGGGKVCGGLLGAGCDADQFCNFPIDAMCGAADQTGTCTSIETGPCVAIYAPVCGCDDKTYANGCVAERVGVSVASEGECPGGPGGGNACGGLQGLACDAGEYCNFPPGAQCGAADQTGKCVPMPDACTKEYAPVCGCDDMTYGNACMAASAGVSVLQTGECGAAPIGFCGTRGGVMCASDQYCQFAPGADCGRADAPGTCADKPEACDLIYSPVCGCDAMTYGNACAAAMAGVSVESQGECAGSAGKTCGGFIGTQCEEPGFFCDYPEDMLCGFADGSGTCKAIPEVCTDDNNPVCGCNGMTYSNACQANAKGVSVASTGACQ